MLPKCWQKCLPDTKCCVRKNSDEITGDTSKWARRDWGEEKKTCFIDRSVCWAPPYPLSLNFSSNSYRSPRKKSLPLWSHHLAFSTVVTLTLKYSIKQHSWEWPRFHVCLLYLWIWAVGRINGELLLKLTPVFPGIGAMWISLAAPLPLLQSERCSPQQRTEVKLFLSFDWSWGWGGACWAFPFLPGTLEYH